MREREIEKRERREINERRNQIMIVILSAISLSEYEVGNLNLLFLQWLQFPQVSQSIASRLPEAHSSTQNITLFVHITPQHKPKYVLTNQRKNNIFLIFSNNGKN